MTDRRSENRNLTQTSVNITVDGVGLRCSMRNLSPSGCMIECLDIVADIGKPVTITLLPGYVAQGQVAWQLGQSIGVFFLEPVPQHVVRHYALDDWMLRGDWSASSLHIGKGPDSPD